MPPAHPFGHRSTYALPALQKYLSHICLPASHQRTLLQNLPSPSHNPPTGTRPSEWGSSLEALNALGTLQKYQQAKMPFANLYLHYSPYHVGTPLDAEGLWRYLVQAEAMVGTGAGFVRSQLQAQSRGVDRQYQVMNEEVKTLGHLARAERVRGWEGRPASGGRGGTCTLNNGFFGTVMRSLGLRVMSTGARVARNYNGANASEDGKFMGWNHLVNLVRVEGNWWLVDVGFGGDGPTAPLKVIDGNEARWGSTASHVRLIHTPISEFTDPSSKAWVLQHKRDSGSEWRHIYCFTTTEFLPQDIKIMNYSTTADVRGSFFNHLVVCSKTVLEGEDVVGTLALVGGRLKLRQWLKDGGGGDEKGKWKSEVLAEFNSEVERWEALDKWFGIVLGDEERAGIKGLVSELKGELEG